MNRILHLGNIEKILAYIRDGIQVVDADGRLMYCNRKAAMMDDIPIQDALGKHILEVYPSLDEETSTLLRVLRTGEPILDTEQHFTTYRGNDIHTLNTTLPLTDVDGVVIGAVEISTNVTAVKQLSEKVLDLQRAVVGPEEGYSDAPTLYRFEDIITRDSDTLRVVSLAMKAARTTAPVLVSGETGTGKELVVQAIHGGGPRRDKPFIVQNCAALPESLLEGILFGTMKGGFTGSVNRPGLFEIANHGTLFLDEINAMPLTLQSKILRVLQDGRFRRVGDVRTREADVRIIAAVNEDPFVAVEAGRLRRDLFYRLNTLSLHLSPLSARSGDVELLTGHFIRRFNGKYFKHVTGISEEALALLKDFNWPGNIRELEHVIENAVIMTDANRLGVADLPRYLQRRGNPTGTDSLHLRTRLGALETQLVGQAMVAARGNVAEAARMLGIPRQTLQYRLKKQSAEN